MRLSPNLPWTLSLGTGALAGALACYRHHPAFVRLFTFGRHLLCPMGKIEPHVPAAGNILDVGCGHGLFTNFIALKSPARRCLGLDLAENKIAAAQLSARELPNVEYRCEAIDSVQGRFDAITILDVLYLLSDDKKLAMLKRCRELLAPTGVLLLKTNDTRPWWKYAIVRTEETIMVRLTRFTFGGELHFRGVPEYLELLRLAGFQADVHRIDGFRPVPHRLFVARPI